MSKKKHKNIKPQTYPKMSLEDFEAYCAVALDNMVQADNCVPSTTNFGAKTFSASGLKDEGFGVIVKCKDGNSFLLSIKRLEESGPQGEISR